MFYFKVDFENAQKMFVKICVRKIEMISMHVVVVLRKIHQIEKHIRLLSKLADFLHFLLTEEKEADIGEQSAEALPSLSYHQGGPWNDKSERSFIGFCATDLVPSMVSIFLSFFLLLLLLYNWIVDQVVEFFML